MDARSVETIDDDDGLYRHIAAKPSQIQPDPAAPEGWRVTSINFRNYELSVDVARLSSPDASLRDRPTHHLVELRAGFARHECQQEVLHDPIPDNYAHALIKGDKPSKTVRRQLADNCKWVVLRTPALR